MKRFFVKLMGIVLTAAAAEAARQFVARHRNTEPSSNTA